METLKSIIQELLWMALRNADQNNIQVNKIIEDIQSYDIEIKKDHVLENIKIKDFNGNKKEANKMALISIIKEIQPMALAYVHGRSTYAVYSYNESIKMFSAYSEVKPSMFAKDGMFDKDYFDKESKKNNFIKGLK